MIVLDTNVISELTRQPPAQAVLRWLRQIPRNDLFGTTMTEAELRFGIMRMPQGRRRDDLLDATERVFRDLFPGRILPFNRPAAAHFAQIAAGRQAIGRRMLTADALIAATARAHGATAIATRDIRDFEHCGVPLVDPWAA